MPRRVTVAAVPLDLIRSIMANPSPERDASEGPATSDTRPPRRRDRRSYSRSMHRARSHDSAHAEGNNHEPARVPDHPLVAPGDAELVATDAGLAELLDHLRDAGSFAYDSEFIGELSYHPKLCLIQVASATRVALIDPLAETDLTPFWELLCDPAVEKIAHAAQQDIEPVVRHLGCAPANLFDTQIAAGFAALPYPVALSKLVLEFTGVRLGKGLTFTHWDQRPLSPSQLRYAADDVRYLPLIRAEIGKRLDALGHAAWARAECDAQCDPALYRFDPQTQYLRVRGAGSLDPRNLAVLRALYGWRDEAAREADLPPRAFLRDEILLDMARTPIKSVERLDRVKGLPRPVEAAHGRTIVDRTLEALALPAPKLPSTGRDQEPPVSEKFRADSLWAAAQAICAGRGIDPALVLSRQDLTEFWQLLRDDRPTAPHRLMTAWRAEALGQPLLDLVAGLGEYTFGWSDGRLRVG
jgi:ribonuclease D